MCVPHKAAYLLGNNITAGLGENGLLCSSSSFTQYNGNLYRLSVDARKTVVC